ncbi:MAG: hypothetical protein ND866_16450 [Pyrinomonadaceae bacterium]|nr:hypothetical protein [Pyrinomonadaceae bacterium]
MALISLLFISVLLTSQQPQPNLNFQVPTDAAVGPFSWRKERLPGWENSNASSTVENYELMRSRVENERRIQQARNTGNKAELGRRESAAKMLEDATAAKDSEKKERPRDGYRYKVLITNTGLKTIRLVDWDYFFIDPSTHEVVARHQFTSQETIKPGKSKEVSVLYLTPPVKTVSASILTQKEPMPFTEQVVIARIEFSDGSVWQHP